MISWEPSSSLSTSVKATASSDWNPNPKSKNLAVEQSFGLRSSQENRTVVGTELHIVLSLISKQCKKSRLLLPKITYSTLFDAKSLESFPI